MKIIIQYIDHFTVKVSQYLQDYEFVSASFISGADRLHLDRTLDTGHPQIDYQFC